MDTYQVGNGVTSIKLSADIRTLHLAASRAITVDLTPPNDSKAVAESADASGDIQPKEIGTPQELRGRRLSVLTRIDLFGTPEERKAAYKNITAIYELSLGAEGQKQFINPDKTAHNNYNRVYLHKTIDLI